MKQTERRGAKASARTVGDLVHQGAALFRARRVAFGHGTVNAFDEAAYLTLHALKLPLDQLAEHLDLRPTRAGIARVQKLFERRVAERKPAAYLTREAWLGEHKFYVDERTIVPRSFIAELLRTNLAPWVPRRARVRTALDLGTGSGCLAVLLAQSFPRARIDAIDISAGALRVARKNVTDYALQGRIRLVRSDLFSELGGKRYDLIISNPPYVRTAVMSRLPREYRHEPELALAAGRDGFDAVRVILAEAAGHLNPHGLLVVEAGHSRARLERAFPRVPFIWLDTSGGDDCVFLLHREDLTGARRAQV